MHSASRSAVDTTSEILDAGHGRDDGETTLLSAPIFGIGMSPTERTSSFAKRFGVTLLAGIPGILALIGYIYLTTP